MSDPKWDFGAVTWIDADAVGQPGQRRFRLRMRNDDLTGTIWLEKEQLQMLGLYIEQLLAQLPDHMARGSLANELLPDAPVPFPEDPVADFRAYRLALGYDEANDMIAILAHELEEAELEEDEVDGDGSDVESIVADAETETNGEAEADESEADGAEAEATPPALICRASRRQLKALSEKITAVIAGGRPRCPLCGAPLNPGEHHVCPRSNGHHKVDLSQLE